MRTTINIIILSATVFLASCGAKSDNSKNALADKKTKLEDLKKQQASISQEVVKLEADIAKLDPSTAKAAKAKLVTVAAIQPETFTHYIDLQARVTAENIAYVTPQNQGGQVKAIYVKQGDVVHKGQLLLKLDDATARTQSGPLQVQLDNAKDILRRRQTLWEQGIGTEVELTSAKTAVSNLEKQMDALNVQLSQYNVYAPMNGVAETVTIKIGETFTPQSATQSGIQIVNTGDLKITANVPENYLGQVKKGTNVLVTFPDINKNITAKVTLTGRVIDIDSRSFYIEAHLPAHKDIRANQLALIKIQDYTALKAITIPLNTLQTDEKGKFVLVAANENGKLIARKRQVTEGQMYGDKLEIKSGLHTGDVVITEGYQGLYDGQLVTTS